jgi:hypothetical protein
VIPQVELLDRNNPDQIREFEENFYQAFLPYDNPAIRELWIWDDQLKRLKTKIPYEEQDIFFVRDRSGKMRTACAFNTAMRSFQSEVYGFNWPPKTESWIEILTLFSEGGGISKLFILEQARRRLGKKGFEACYATSAAKVVHLHTDLGAVIIDQKIYNEQVRMLILSGFNRPFVNFKTIVNLVKRYFMTN